MMSDSLVTREASPFNMPGSHPSLVAYSVGTLRGLIIPGFTLAGIG